MHNLSAWSLNLGRWGRLRVRLHAFFLLCLIFTLYLCSQSGGDQLIGFGLVGMAILFASVVLHELGHCYAALRIGGRAEEIVVGPLGGLAQVSVTHEPQRELITALAGPMVNLILTVFSGSLVYLIGKSSLLGLMNPLAPAGLIPVEPVAGTARLLAVSAVHMTFWINLTLLVVNLLPAFPFDGGRMLRSLLWPTLGYRTAVVWVGRTGNIMAIGFCVLGWAAQGAFPEAFVPVWVPLVLLALFIYFSARQEIDRLGKRQVDSGLFGYDFSQGYTSLDRDGDMDDVEFEEVGILERWRERRREQRQRMRRQQEDAEEARVDEILARLHKTGLTGLTLEERELLDRVSARYRNRLRHQT